VYTLGAKTWAVGVHPDGAVIGDASLAGGIRAVEPGNRVQLYGTGLEKSPAGSVLSAVISIGSPVRVRIGGTPAVVEFAGWISPGLAQINIVVPDLPAGDHEITMEVSGAVSPAGVVIPVRR
jgi:uncharacterized protein (TIGR03437 family)